MIHREIITIPEAINSTVSYRNFAMGTLAPKLLPLGYEPIDSNYIMFQHVDTGAKLAMWNSYHHRLVFSVGYNIDKFGSITVPFIINNRVITHKENDIEDGFGIIQLTWCIDDSTTWFAFSGYNQIDTISGGVVLSIDDKQVDTANGNVYQGSSSLLGTVTPAIRDFTALPEKTHISDAFLVNGSFILEDVPRMKGFASAEIQTYRFYDINGQRYLALPNRLLLEC